mmetsp:Transcript_57174/g.122822  ORF Transcript_57174/g.122822 Transcript_57174/m.122822 type:complete len:740 (-) Transcript_57174:188-2407(-)
MRVSAALFSAGLAADGRPCDVAPGKGQPWCDATKSLDDRVADLVSRIPEKDVVGLFANGASGVPELNIPAYQWWSEALHGVGKSPGVTFSGKTPSATSFPQVITTASSFNTTLFRAIGSAISTEARAFNNQGHAGNTFWTPNINIYRDPRWGRGQETPGEDPVLNGEYAANFVPGMQDGEDPNHIKSSACLKHFAAYSLENYQGMDRHHFDAQVSQQDLEDTYFPAFKTGIQKGNASGLMCSYNAVNGVPSCANTGLLNGLARKEWGFDGYITSDCGAVEDVFSNHKYDPSADHVVTDVLEAGMDSDCGAFLGKHMQDAITTGVVSKDDFNAALTNMFRVRMRLGHFDPVDTQPYLKYGVDKINTPDHQELALEAARQGIVLLKNDGGALPLDASKVKKIAIIGPHANATTTMQGNYQGVAPYLISPAEGLQKFAEISVQHGCDVDSKDTSGIAPAADAAADADVTVLFIGIDQSQEKEGHDRSNITLPGVQYQLIDAVAAKAKGPVVLVVMSGGAVDVADAKGDSRIASIVWAGYPGQSGGQAIAEILFGAVNPSGRLTQTWYPTNYLTQCSFFDMNMRSNTTTGCPGRTHRFYTGPATYKFGDGMSYTTFQHEILSSVQLVRGGDVQSMLASGDRQGVVAMVRATVSNTGKRDGSVVSMVMIKPPSQENGAPVQQLRAFRRTALKAGESRDLEFEVTAEDLSFAHPSGSLTTIAGKWVVDIEGATAGIDVGSGVQIV